MQRHPKFTGLELIATDTQNRTLPILNSKYIRDVYEQNVKEGGRVFPQVKLEKLKPLPIVIPTPEERKIVEDIVLQIIALKSKFENTEKLEEQLNKFVANLYS